MSQKTLEKINREISNLKGEMKIFRSLIIGLLGKDREGEYRSEFVKKILRLSKKRAGFAFKNAESFLKQIQKSL